MMEHGVTGTFFLDIRDNARSAAEGEAFATAQIDTFLVENWPFGRPRPDVYYDPRTAVPRPPW